VTAVHHTTGGAVSLTVVVAIVTAALTASLAVITWRYARSTEAIARETAGAVEAARVAAQVSLLQALLGVQPVIDIGRVDVEYWSGGHGTEGPQIPIALAWEVTNSGAGNAYSIEFAARIGPVTLPAPDKAPPRQLARGESVGLRQQTGEAGLSTLRTAVAAGGVANAELIVRCRDAYGASVVVTCCIPVHGSRVDRTVSRTYEGGEELRGLLRKVVREVLPTPR
jgi:hypothetical protein